MTSIPWLSPGGTDFPPASRALDDPNGLLAAGGDLTPARLIEAYRGGIFPWFDDQQPILWWSPDPRCVLFPEQMHISRSLRKRLRRGDYRVTLDSAFTEVIGACAQPRQDSESTWITTQMTQAYTELHRRGIAHSVEVWMGDNLVGGLYGLAMGRLFFGESMFSRGRDASKIALVRLVEQLRLWGYHLIDCQVYSDHLASLGATEIPRKHFLEILNREVDAPAEHAWAFE
ncbi:leucyl/phenylalanyl-tRNA--protein transferase [Motiliproteus sp. SC1-56]|uniref:leucyl/phenylalanyl-tRNA--protein transferase n=1 Tax=Motiliproteus sp. SC1-56 TaxID=2799565 RepID=UPI001A8F0840|nr:leucyl/phenylalanyl-tRNA--protein transferase [Motiliproteus sp. SC1-56]